MKQIILCIVAIAAIMSGCSRPTEDIFLEAENMNDCGGWVVDQQSMMQMGSPYLMAHGMGRLVEDATTEITLDEGGSYRMWVRTIDWTRRWGKEQSAGQFQVVINSKATKAIFGTEQAKWHWQDGGIVCLKGGINKISLHDLTGFNGRCDAIYFAADKRTIPPADGEALAAFRKEKSGIEEVADGGEYDLVVVGGGIAGCCAAVSAARLGCKVALIHNRPVLGGNNSSEVRVGLSGLIMQQPYPNLGLLMDELGGVGHWTKYEAEQNPNSERSRQIMNILEQHPEKIQHNAGPKSNYEDEKKLDLLLAEQNITLILSTHVTEVEKEGNKIVAVKGRDIKTGEETIFRGKLFADCTGDALLARLAGCETMYGREAKETFGESLCYLAREASHLYILTATGAEVLWMDAAVFLAEGQADPFVYLLFSRFTAMLAARTLEMNERIQILSKLTLREKLLTFFAGWERRAGQKTFQIPFDRASLAVYLGTNRAALSRELARMQQEGLIEFYRSSFKILI